MSSRLLSLAFLNFFLASCLWFAGCATGGDTYCHQVCSHNTDKRNLRKCLKKCRPTIELYDD